MRFLDSFRRPPRQRTEPCRDEDVRPLSTPPSPGAQQPAMRFDGLGFLAGGADRICVVDCETTGVYNSDRVVELAIVTVDLNGNTVDAWDTLVHPQRDVGATHIHGLTAERLADAPVFSEIAGDVALRLDGACLAAHNLPFDQRMVVAEFARLGADLTILAGIDTLHATRARLGVACAAHGIDHQNAHSALADALATAELLLRVAQHCAPGHPAAAPSTLLRSGRVLRRADAAPCTIPDPPHIAALAARLDHSGLEAHMLAYLELVDRAVADLQLDSDERRQLNALAHELGLDDARIAQAHRRLVNDLIDAAMADHVVTDDELDVLLRVATCLDVDTGTVERRTRPALATAVTITIEPNLNVVFTGDDPGRPRDELARHAERLGMTVGQNVTKSTDLLVAYETASSSGKAGKARSYGVPIVDTAQFATAQAGDPLDAQGAAVESKKVVTCPDCRATWTVSARSGARSSRRCEQCSSVTAGSATPVPDAHLNAPAQSNVEVLVCGQCGCTWSRERVRGRKPRLCRECA
jgi:DNA polymerase-3 subunit epsilon